MTKSIYAEYHGKIIQAFLAHFDEDFSSTVATALGDGVFDVYKAKK